MDPKEIDAKLGEFAARVKAIGEEITALLSDDRTEAKARLDELKAEQTKLVADVAPLLAAKEKADLNSAVAAQQEQLNALMASTRTASKAGLPTASSLRDPAYRAGSFLFAVKSLDPTSQGWSPESHAKAKATLDQISAYEESFGKATLGTTDAAGGWIVPNAIVDEFIRPSVARNIYRDLLTVREGVTAFAVDIPFRSGVPARAVIAPFGSTKENVDLAYNGYTATMYTLARIEDIGNQFLRQSAGAAEADVMAGLAEAFQLGESYYIREGSGSSEPYGYTAALTNGPGAFRTSFTPNATNLANSIAAAIAAAAGALSGRGVAADRFAAVLSATSYWTMISQGTDSAGFFFNPAGGPNAINGVRAGVLMSPFGIPVYADAAADQQGTAAVIDNLVVGDWKALKVYFGQNFRIESSSVAGTRWDANLTGFRGEEEMGFDARPAVYAGKLQMITDIVP